MIKILFAYGEVDKRKDNPYVYTLIEAIRNEGCKVDCSLDFFWNNYKEYDIIHFQWPEAVFDWKTVKKEDIKKLNSHLTNIRENNIKIIYTRHNIKPHYSFDINRIELYEIIENNCDVIIHLGNYSLNQFNLQNKKNNILHYVIPHHTYDTLYSLRIDKNFARKQLKIDDNKFVFLCFGAFRDDEERNMVVKSFIKLDYTNKFLLAPRFYKYAIHLKHPRAFVRGIIERLKFGIQSKKTTLSAKFVDNEMLPYYFSSADVVFIQRCNILNSGNIPMAFHFGRTVIGPTVGNVGELLNTTGNITFSPINSSSIVNAMKKSIEKAHSGQGVKNKEYAENNLKTQSIAKQIKQVYVSTLSEKYIR